MDASPSTSNHASAPVVRTGLLDLLLSRRPIAVVIVVVCATLLTVAALLDPSPTGMGTHTQMGLPPCNWIVVMDLPCPTCGYTTAFSSAAHGQFIDAFDAQPFGALLALATAVLLLSAIWVLITGAPLGSALCRFWSAKATWIVLSLMILAWGYKMLRFKGLL